MKEIAISQGKFAMVDDEDFESLSKHTWCYLSGYAVRHSKKDEGKKRLIFMHRQIVNAPDRRRIFHVDGNRLNCQKENIRVPPPTVKKTVESQLVLPRISEEEVKEALEGLYPRCEFDMCPKSYEYNSIVTKDVKDML